MRITSKGPGTIQIEIRDQSDLFANTRIPFEYDGKVVRILPVKTPAEPSGGARLVAHLRGRGDIAMSTDETTTLTRED